MQARAALLIMIVAVASFFAAAASCSHSRTWSDAESNRIREELVRRAAHDQQVRSVDFSQLNSSERSAAFDRAQAVDRDNTSWLKSLVDDRGWPTVDRVGAEASRGAFLIVQHADHDPEFQAECLPILTGAAERGAVPMLDVAYLTDRVRVKQRRPQLYGTQYYVRELPDGSAYADEHGRLVYLLPIVEDIDTLDERRREAGLTEWSEYELGMARSQGREPAPRPRAWDGRLPVDPQRPVDPQYEPGTS